MRLGADGQWKALRVAYASCPNAGCSRGRHIYASVPAHGHFTVYDAPRSSPSFKCRYLSVDKSSRIRVV